MTPLRFRDSERKENPPETEVYSPSSLSVVAAYGGAVLSLLISMVGVVGILGALGFLFDQSERPPHPFAFFAVFSLWVLVFLGLAFICFIQAQKFRGVQIEITPRGVTRSERGGRQVFIGWENMARLTDRLFMGDLVVRDDSENRSISINYQIRGFDEVRDRVAAEFEKRVKLPPLPATYRFTPQTKKVLFAVFAGLYAGAVVYSISTSLNEAVPVALFGGIALGLLFLYSFISFALTVNKLTLTSEGVELNRFFGMTFIAWKHIEGIEQRLVGSENNERLMLKMYRVKLVGKNGKAYRFASSLGNQLDMVVTVRKFLAEYQRPGDIIPAVINA